MPPWPWACCWPSKKFRKDPLTDAEHPRGIARGCNCPKRALPFWDRRLAVCRAHNLFAEGEQIPHLQPESIFVQVHAPDENDCTLFAACGRQTLRGFLISRHPRRRRNGGAVLCEEHFVFTAGRRCPPPRPGHRPASGRGSAAWGAAAGGCAQPARRTAGTSPDTGAPRPHP